MNQNEEENETIWEKYNPKKIWNFRIFIKISKFTSKFQLNINKLYNKIIVLIFATFLSLIMAGTIFGWSSLLLVLIDQKVYSEYCFPDVNDPTKIDCKQRDYRFALVYSFASVCMVLFQSISGALLDFWGPRIHTSFGCFLFFLGGCLFSLSKFFDGYIPAAIFFTVGGYVMFVGLIPLSDFYRPYTGTVLSIINCAFDSSTLVFILYYKLYQITKFQSYYFFMVLNIIPVIGIIGTLFWPRNYEETQPLNTEIQEEIKEISEIHENVDIKEEQNFVTPKQPEPQFEDWKVQAKSILYIGFIIVWCIHELWINVYIGSIETRVSFLSGDNKDLYIEIFGWILPSTIIVSPLIGYSIDKIGNYSTFLVIQIISTIFSITLLINVIWVQIISFILFALYRGYFFSWCFQFLITEFGVTNFGKLFAIASFFCGIFGLLQYLCYYIAIIILNRDYFWLNIVQLVSIIVANIYVIYCYWLSYNKRKKQKETNIIEPLESLEQDKPEFKNLEEPIDPFSSKEDSIEITNQ